MAAETDGAALEVSKGNSIEKLFAEIEDSLRSQYSIWYTPARPDDSGKFHKIKLTVRNRGLIVRTRDGYYSRYTPHGVNRERTKSARNSRAAPISSSASSSGNVYDDLVMSGIGAENYLRIDQQISLAFGVEIRSWFAGYNS